MRKEIEKALKGVDTLLSIDAYGELYQTVVDKRPRNILEIGTAHGGGTIAMALGAKSIGLNCNIQTVDVLSIASDIPTSRAKFGDAKTNEAIVRKNFSNADVQDFISLFVGRSDEFAKAGLIKEQIDMLVLDADGRIDRDLLQFKNYLTNGAVIVVDDTDGGPKLSNPIGNKCIDLKHVITNKLLSKLLEKGLLAMERRNGNTAFCKAVDPQNWDEEALKAMALETYRELVFTDISDVDFLRIFIAKPLLKSKIGKLVGPFLRIPCRFVTRILRK